MTIRRDPQSVMAAIAQRLEVEGVESNLVISTMPADARVDIRKDNQHHDGLNPRDAWWVSIQYRPIADPWSSFEIEYQATGATLGQALNRLLNLAGWD